MLIMDNILVLINSSINVKLVWKNEIQKSISFSNNNIEYLNREYNIIHHILNNYNEKMQSVRSNLKKVFDIEQLYENYFK